MNIKKTVRAVVLMECIVVILIISIVWPTLQHIQQTILQQQFSPNTDQLIMAYESIQNTQLAMVPSANIQVQLCYHEASDLYYVCP